MIFNKPWMAIPPQLAHKIAPYLLKAYGRLHSYQTLAWNSFSWRGIEFTNPLGLAGGIDKDINNLEDWWPLGPGFVEVGTITPNPQMGHSGQVIERDVKNQNLWNKLGFPSKGLANAEQKIKALYKPHFTPVFANIGKNRTTPNEKAHEDYIKCIMALNTYVDAFVINISSPNTEGLRELLQEENFQNFLAPLFNVIEEQKPLILKLSPDMSADQLKSCLDTSLKLGINGWILTNTTAARAENSTFPTDGGVSGKALAKKSKEFLKLTIDHLGDSKKDKLVISTGGILSPEDVFERIELGADLVQVYSALIFSGPNFFRKVADKAPLRT